MFVKKILFSCAAFGLLANLSAYGEKIESTKQAPIQNLLPNAYGEASVRNYFQSENSRWQARAAVGSTFFDGQFNLRAVVGANKFNGTTLLKDRGTRIEAELEAYSNDFWTLMPYAQVWFQRTSEEGRRVLLGMANDVSMETDMNVGTLSFAARHDFTMNFGTKEQYVSVTADGSAVPTADVNMVMQKRFGLVAEAGQLKAVQTSPTLMQEVSGNVSLALASVPGTSMTLGAVYGQTLTPKMTWSSENQKLTTPRSGTLNLPSYNTTGETWGQVGVKYDWTDSLYVSCDAWMAAKTTDGKRPFKVRTSIGMDLF